MLIWERFPELVAVVKKLHEEAGLAGGHHDIYHACRVGQVAYRIFKNEWEYVSEALVASAAGVCHNADRVLEEKTQQKTTKEAVSQLVDDWLVKTTGFTSFDRGRIVDAVLKHTGRNSPQDSSVLIALMDADRVVNLDMDLLPRSGQNYKNLPVVDMFNFLDDPDATYRNPKSVLRDIAYSLEWLDPASPFYIRTRLGRLMGTQRGIAFRMMMDTLKYQLEEEGILGVKL